MAVAFDASSRSGSAVSASVASFSWTHTPVGTPKGVCVVVAGSTSATNDVTSVTYGGTAVPRVTGAFAADSAGEPSFTDVYFLGSSVPTGAQTVVVNRNNNANGVWGAAATVTAGADTEVYTTGIVLLQGDQALVEQNVTDGSTGVDSLRFGILSSGAAALTPAGANSTRLQTVQPSSRNIDFYRETTAGQGSRPVGAVLVTSDDVAMSLFAVREVVAGGTTFTQALTANATATASIVKQVNKNVTANGTVTVTIQKQINKLLTANATATATLQALKVILLTLTANATATASIRRQTNKNVRADATASATMQRQINKLLTANVSATASIQALKVVLLTLIANATATASIRKQVNKIVRADATSSASIRKTVQKTLLANATSTAIINKVIPLTLTAAATATASINAVYHAASAAVSRARYIVFPRSGIY